METTTPGTLEAPDRAAAVSEPEPTADDQAEKPVKPSSDVEAIISRRMAKLAAGGR